MYISVSLSKRSSSTKFYQLLGTVYVDMANTCRELEPDHKEDTIFSGFVSVKHRHSGRRFWHSRGNNNARFIQLVCEEHGYKLGLPEQVYNEDSLTCH
jgi:hypothetical protein